jgi:hypothetical protein
MIPTFSLSWHRLLRRKHFIVPGSLPQRHEGTKLHKVLVTILTFFRSTANDQPSMDLGQQVYDKTTQLPFLPYV